MNKFFSYVDAIGFGWPDVQVHCVGDDTIYENVIWDGGDPLPSKQELDAWIIAQTKDKVWKLIQEERTRRQAGGVFIQSANKWFHSDQQSRSQHIGLVMMGQSMPPNIQWKTMDGSFVTMSPQLASQIFMAVAAHDMTAFAVAEQHRAAMVASEDPANYDFSGGWPPIYGG